MATRKVPIDKATDEELRQFARERLGIEPHSNWKPETVLAKVKAAWDKAEIELEDKPQPAVEQPSMAPLRQSGIEAQAQPAKVTVFINSTDKMGGDRPVELGVNGKIMLVPRDKEQEIPYAYFHVLENAVEYRYEPGPGGVGINPVPRKIPLYPYRRVA